MEKMWRVAIRRLYDRIAHRYKEKGLITSEAYAQAQSFVVAVHLGHIATPAHFQKALLALLTEAQQSFPLVTNDMMEWADAQARTNPVYLRSVLANGVWIALSQAEKDEFKRHLGVGLAEDAASPVPSPAEETAETVEAAAPPVDPTAPAPIALS